MKNFLNLSLWTVAACLLIHSPSLFAQGGTPVFQPRYVPEVLSTPGPRPEPSKPIARGWIIGGAAAAFVVGGILLFAAGKAWRAAKIFERKYHFPPAGSAALRFGGNRSGGLMATIEPAKNKRKA